MYRAKKFLVYIAGVTIFALMAVITLSCMKKAIKDDSLISVEPLILRVMKEWKIPGLAIAIVKDGQTVMAKGFGVSDLETQKKVDIDTIFRIGSCAKAFTATSVGMLIDQSKRKQKITWDDPIRKHVPWFKMHDGYVTDHATIRDALLHRTGIPTEEIIFELGLKRSRKEAVEGLRYVRPSKEFRTEWQYSNLMYTTVGFLIENKIGASWENFVTKNLFTPLKMKRSNFLAGRLKEIKNSASPYEIKKGKIRTAYFRDISIYGPAGGINSTVSDMANWIKLNLNNGKFEGKKIVSPEIMKEVHKPQIIAAGYGDKENPIGCYALGWGFRVYRGHRLLSHAGGVLGFTSMVCILPENNVGIVILANLSDADNALDAIQTSIIDRLLGLEYIDWYSKNKLETEKDIKEKEEGLKKRRIRREEKRHKGQKFKLPIDSLVGTFDNSLYGVIEIKKINDNELKMKWGSLTASLRHYHDNVFETVNSLRGGMSFEELDDEDIEVKVMKDLVIGIVIDGIEFQRKTEVAMIIKLHDRPRQP